MPFHLLKLLFLIVFLTILLLLLLYTTLSSSLPMAARPSLFPTSAIISLAEDNSTFFLSRPAAFGPSLPKIGLTGQLYALEETELACDDVPEGDEINTHSFADDRLLSEAFGNGRITDSEFYPGKYTIDVNSRKSATPPKSSKTEHGDNSNAVKPYKIHADIETIQESAEIKGKIVLVNRGGCGFLEKVLWSQRRGAVAVIVGDNEAHRPLLTMYAKGDTTNVSIPSIFTSYTTAHLLISLLPRQDIPFKTTPDGRLPQLPPAESFPTILSTPSSKLPHGRTYSNRLIKDSIKSSQDSILSSSLEESASSSGTFPVAKDAKPKKIQKISSSHRPPLSGEFEGIVLESDPPSSSIIRGNTASGGKAIINAALGAHDEDGRNVKSGSIGFDSLGWIGSSNQNSKSIDYSQDPLRHLLSHDSHKPDMSEGLWITLTPTRMSSSPLVDTLLVLVVSPLVTLTVVYTMLLLRSRYRRRRWRAPKSVVDQLPVHTYHAVPETTSAPTSTAVSPRLDPATPPLEKRSGASTPILPLAADDVPQVPTSSSARPAVPLTQSPRQSVNPANTVTFRYFPPSKECVVCLDEYVDDVSRIMRLPCGHEFHVDCITPWLTTRRRTCPICKKCVVSGLGLEPSGIGRGSGNGNSASAQNGFYGWSFARVRDFFTGHNHTRSQPQASETTPLITHRGEDSAA